MDMIKERHVMITARAMSMLFTPFYLPMLGMIALFWCSYLSAMPWIYKVKVLLMVYFFTILLPTLLIRFYRQYQGWTLIELGAKERRMVPYVISILCYFACYYLMHLRNFPHVVSIILMVALMIQVACAIINVWWKISTHTAAIGGVGGALFIYGEYFGFNPVWWLCLVFVVGGMVGSSRMILRQHSLSQVVVGFWMGFACAAIAILFL